MTPRGATEPLLRVSRGPDACTLVVEGELDVATSRELVRAALEAPAAELRLDLSGVTFIDVSGVRCLLTIRQGLGTGELILLSPHPRVRRVLDLLLPGEAPWFRIVADDEDLVMGDRG